MAVIQALIRFEFESHHSLVEQLSFQLKIFQYLKMKMFEFYDRHFHGHLLKSPVMPERQKSYSKYQQPIQ